MKSSWLAPIAAAAVTLGSFALASQAPGEVELGRGEFSARKGEPTHIARGSACATEMHGKVVSAALLADELLLELLPPGRLGGVSYVVDAPGSTPDFGRFPANIPRVSGGAEDVLLARPELVVISDYTSGAAAAQLSSAGVCVLRLRAPQKFEDLFTEIAELGDATATRERAATLAARGHARLAALAPAAPARPAPRVLLVQDPYAYGPGTLQADCLRRAGLDNVLDGGAYGKTPILGVEQLLSLDPDVVFLATDTKEPRALRTERRPIGGGWAHMRALDAGRAFEVPSTWMASISHHAIDACEAYARFSRGGP